MSNMDVDEWIDLVLNDPRTSKEIAPTSRNGVALLRAFASLSLLCSSTIIATILRSNSRFSTTYHRIIFTIAILDGLYSVGMIMSTLLFPSETIYDQIEGPIIGSMTTCRFQGFLILFSSQATIVRIQRSLGYLLYPNYQWETRPLEKYEPKDRNFFQHRSCYNGLFHCRLSSIFWFDQSNSAIGLVSPVVLSFLVQYSHG